MRMAHSDDTVSTLIDWAEWRGRMDSTVRGHSDRLADLSSGLYARLSDLDRNFNRRMDKQDEVIGSIFEQGRRTNGRVTGLEEREAVRDGVEGDRHQAHHDRAVRSRFRVGSIVAVIAAAVGSGTTELVHLIFG